MRSLKVSTLNLIIVAEMAIMVDSNPGGITLAKRMNEGIIVRPCPIVQNTVCVKLKAKASGNPKVTLRQMSSQETSVNMKTNWPSLNRV